MAKSVFYGASICNLGFNACISAQGIVAFFFLHNDNKPRIRTPLEPEKVTFA